MNKWYKIQGTQCRLPVASKRATLFSTNSKNLMPRPYNESVQIPSILGKARTLEK